MVLCALQRGRRLLFSVSPVFSVFYGHTGINTIRELNTLFFYGPGLTNFEILVWRCKGNQGKLLFKLSLN